MTVPGPGRSPDAFKAMCAGFASRDETAAAVARILEDDGHPAFMGALKWATENGYGAVAQRHELSGPGGAPLRFSLAIGAATGDDA